VKPTRNKSPVFAGLCQEKRLVESYLVRRLSGTAINSRSRMPPGPFASRTKPLTAVSASIEIDELGHEPETMLVHIEAVGIGIHVIVGSSAVTWYVAG